MSETDQKIAGEPRTLSAQVVEPKFVVRADYVSDEGKPGSATRISDAVDAAEAAIDVLADLKARRPGVTVTRVEAFKPSPKNLVPRGVLG